MHYNLSIFLANLFSGYLPQNQMDDEVHAFSDHAGLKWYVDIRHLYDPYISEYGVMEILEPHNSKLNWKMHNSKPSLKILFPAYPKCGFHHFCSVLTWQKEQSKYKIN